MEKTFAPINLLLKGSSVAIQKALAQAELPEYELRLFSYDPDCVDPSDTSIKSVGLVFELFSENYMTADEFPFASIPDVKFLCLGDGGDGYRADGTYAAFKDFGETSVQICYRFSRANPHMEEFEEYSDVLEQVRESFLDHVWAFEYEDYSCGEFLKYAFRKEKDIALIGLWENDSHYNADGVYTDTKPDYGELFSSNDNEDDEDFYEEEY